MHPVFGDLGQDREFVAALGDALRQIEAHGVRAAVARALDDLDRTRSDDLLTA
jgi:hypothetical protein